MSDLGVLQGKLQTAILGQEEHLPFIKVNGVITTSDRLTVHRDTVFNNLTSSLRITYPGIWRLLGEDCAYGVAMAYSHDYVNLTSRSAMDDFGENFPQFLANFPSIKHLQYLPDFARLELLRAKSYRAIMQAPLAIEQLQAYFESGIESCQILLNASIYFLQSEYPLMNIQELLDNPDSVELSLQKQECFLVVCRTSGKTETLFLEARPWNFLRSISNGNSVSTAMDMFTEKELVLKIQAMISLMVSKQMIIKIQE